MEDKMKTIGIKISIKDDKTVDMIARKKGIAKVELYREIINEYFKANPLTPAEQEVISNMR